jgi:hypothetical protein
MLSVALDSDRRARLSRPAQVRGICRSVLRQGMEGQRTSFQGTITLATSHLLL